MAGNRIAVVTDHTEDMVALHPPSHGSVDLGGLTVDRIAPGMIVHHRLPEIAVRSPPRAHLVHDDPPVLEVELDQYPVGTDAKRVDRFVGGRRSELLDMEPRHLLRLQPLQPYSDAASILAVECLQVPQGTGGILKRKGHSSPSSASTWSCV